uniref:uncharacterized protein n=1 Tax=Pristiophorus japonicus TaxID=55135 RepID=UPI00398F2777
MLKDFTEGNDWDAFMERLEYFFIANDLTGNTNALIEKRKAILLSSCGDEVYRLVRDLLAPVSAKDKSYEQLIELIRNQLKPKESILMARHKFYHHCRPEGQDITKYAADIRRLAAPCDFGTHLNEALRDVFVMGIGHEGLLHKLLSTEPTVSLQQAINISRAFMTSTCSTKQMIHTISNPAGTIHRIAPFMDKTAERGSAQGREHGPQDPGTQSPPRGANQVAPCWRCGGSHGAHQYRFAEYTCNTCHTKGHLQRMCKRNMIHHVAEEMVDDLLSSEEHCGLGRRASQPQVEEDDAFGLYTCTDDSAPMIMEVKINGVPVSMEVDMGSGQSLMSQEIFDKLWINPAAQPKLVPVTAKLRTYTKELIPVLGKADVQVSHGDKTHGLPLWIIAGDGPTLLIRRWMGKVRGSCEDFIPPQTAVPRVHRQRWPFAGLAAGGAVN